MDDTNSIDNSFWEEDGFSMTGSPNPSPDTIIFGSGIPGGLGDDHITLGTNTFNLNLNMNNESVVRESTNGFWKYEEDITLKEIQDYLSGTYKSHYTSQESKTQTLDLIESIGDAEAFCRSNAIKYLSRFGKKNGKSKLDILKAIHYCVLLYHFSGLHKQTSSYPH